MNVSTMNPEQAVTSLSALAQSSRLKIFRLLVVAGDQGCTVGDIGKQLELPSATLSFHLKELAHSGLIEKKTTRSLCKLRCQLLSNEVFNYIFK